MPVQHTLAQTVEATGVGLHTGRPVSVCLCPAPAGHGIAFTREDLGGGIVVPATVEHVVDTRLATSIARDGHRVTTIEHLMAALLGEEVDNLLVKVDGPEVPALDGSAARWVELIRQAGLAAQDHPRRAIRVTRPIEVRIDKRVARLLPADRFEVAARIDFDHPMVGEQRGHVVLENGSFGRELAWARTFGFLRHVDALRRMGLVLGGTYDNAIVYDDNGVLNEGGLKSDDEPVRHKMLDIIGDVALLGSPLQARLEADLPGHGLTLHLIRELLDRPECWEYTDHPVPDQTGHKS